MINKFSILNGAKYFYSGIFQNYLVFIQAKKYVKYFSWTTQTNSWKSNGILEENIENTTKSDSSLAPTFADYHVLTEINFNGHCLINNNISVPKKVINVNISYITNQWSRDLNTYFKLGNCLFGSVELTKNTDPNRYKYCGYVVIFDSCLKSSFTNGSMRRNIIIFEADMISSVHVDNKNKDILILGKGPIQGLDDTTLTAEAKYPINFTQPRKRFVLSLHYNGSNSVLFVNTIKIYQFKSKYSEIKD